MIFKRVSFRKLAPLEQLLLGYVFIALFITILVIGNYKNLPKPEQEMYVQTPQTGLGLGQCHWIGGSMDQYSGLQWGYSGSTMFDFSDGAGDTWAAVEPQKGVFKFNQMHDEVNFVKLRGQKMILTLNAFMLHDKLHNIPKWALDNGVEAVVTSACGNLTHYRNTPTFKWYDPTSTHTIKNSVKPLWNNPQFVDQSEATLLTASGVVTTDLSQVDSVRFITKNAVVWDPKFRELFANALRAMKMEFQADIDDGTIAAINMMSGGNDGECTFGISCYPWDTGCTPDVINPQCPIIQSMAKFVQKQYYSNMTVEQVTQDVIAKRSDCNPNNVIPGNKVQLCTQSDQSKCPTAERGSACYVFDDYFIQAVKEMISTYVEIFAPTPLVWQYGNGLTGTGRVSGILQDWMNSNYQYNIWFKFNGWGSRDRSFWSRGFNNYSNAGAHGYEPDLPSNFSKNFYKSYAQTWCNNYLSKECKEDINCLIDECKTSPLDTEAVGRRAAAIAVKRGIVDDRSSLLCMQGAFFKDPITDKDNDGLKENQYYFNPSDNDPNCSTSEINVRDFGVGFCPGFLNKIMQANVPILPNGTARPNPTATPRTSSTPLPNTGDLNSDGKTNEMDLIVAMSNWSRYGINTILTILKNWKN